MRNILKTLLISTLLLVPVTTALATPYAGAVDVLAICSDATAKTTDVCKEAATQQNNKTNPVIKALRITVSIMSFVIGLTAVIMLIIGAIGLSTSGGDPQKVSSARGTITYAIIGIVVAALAETLVAFVLNKI